VSDDSVSEPWISTVAAVGSVNVKSMLPSPATLSKSSTPAIDEWIVASMWPDGTSTVTGPATACDGCGPSCVDVVLLIVPTLYDATAPNGANDDALPTRPKAVIVATTTAAMSLVCFLITSPLALSR
jgi:hypothetical protein